MQNFKDLPNVYCKISGMVTEADWKNWRYPDFTPVLDTITDVFGFDRLMYGSDWPVCLLAGSYKNILDIVKTYTSDWSMENKEKIFYKNAVQFYNLDL
jgi:L-fuconolactonase